MFLCGLAYPQNAAGGGIGKAEGMSECEPPWPGRIIDHVVHDDPQTLTAVVLCYLAFLHQQKWWSTSTL